MNQLSRFDLLTLDQYAKQRSDYRAKVIAHKKNRRIALGPNATLHFEDRLTMQYQIQEILRIEKIFEAGSIEEELAAYKPLIPNGSNWKATFMIEFENEDERKVALARMIGIEKQIWVQVRNHGKVYPITNEDLERATTEKTSALHFLRFELTASMIKSTKSGAEIRVGVEHPEYHYVIELLPENIRQSLADDLRIHH